MRYTTSIKWGIHEVDARPFGQGFWGKRMPQQNPRVNAYELKINPYDESFYLPHPDGGYVQFENLAKDILQDGKLIMKPRSLYHVEDMPEFAKTQVLAEARRQVAAAQRAGYNVEWLVSDNKAVEQLKRTFQQEGVAITVKHLPE